MGASTTAGRSSAAAGPTHLGKAKTYAQSKCQHGWCAYVYALYFEKDQAQNGLDVGGHKHDWESVVVFQKQGEERPRFLAASRHGGFSTHPINEVPMDGNRVKIVYHKDGSSTHAFRFAKWGEVPRAWGPNSGWDQSALLTMEKMPDAPRNALWNSSWGRANFPLTNRLAGTINEARKGEKGGRSIEGVVPAFS